MPDDSKVLNALWTFTLILLQPTTIISLFGPAVINANLRFLMGDVALSNEVEPKLISAMRNEWTVGISEWETQLYTYVMAFMVLFSEIIAFAVFLALRSDTRRVVKKAKQSYLSIALVFLLLVNVFFFMSSVVFGGVGSIEVVQMYVPPAEDLHKLDFAIPPVESLITWGRVLVVLGGVVLVIWANATLPAKR